MVSRRENVPLLGVFDVFFDSPGASGELQHSPRLSPFMGRVLGLLVEEGEEKNYRCMPWCSSSWNSGILEATACTSFVALSGRP